MSLTTNSDLVAATTGNLIVPSVVAEGRVKNPLVSQAGLTGSEVSYEYDGDNPESVRVVATIDGDVLGESTADDDSFVLTASTLSSGRHLLALSTMREQDEGLPDSLGDVDGSRIWLTWSAATATDLAEYVVYHDDGAGGAQVERERISTIVPDRVYRAGATSGSGTSLLTVRGVFSGTTPHNGAWRILVAAGAATFQVDPGTGSYGTAQQLYEGVEYEIGNGLTAFFDGTGWVAADRWDFRVGPRREYVSDEVADGTYLCKISAVDSAGNESSQSTAATVVIDQAPDAPTDLAVTYSGGTFTATWNDPADADLSSVRIYTNWSVDFADLAEGEVIFDYHVASASAGAETVGFTPSATPNGDWYFVARAVDSDGRESRNADAVLVVLPTASVGIGVPFDVRATPIAGGSFRIAWRYDTRDGAVTHFDVYVNTSSSSPSFASAASSPAAAPTGPVFEQTVDLGPYVGVRYFTVRARNATLSLASINTDLTTGTPDATAPSAPTGLSGLAT